MDNTIAQRDRANSLPVNPIKKVTIHQSVVARSNSSVARTESGDSLRRYPKVEYHDPTGRGHRGRSGIVKPSRGVVVRSEHIPSTEGEPNARVNTGGGANTGVLTGGRNSPSTKTGGSGNLGSKAYFNNGVNTKASVNAGSKFGGSGHTGFSTGGSVNAGPIAKDNVLWEKAVRELELVIAQKDTAIENLSQVNRKLSGDVQWYEGALEESRGKVGTLEAALKKAKEDRRDLAGHEMTLGEYKDKVRILEARLKHIENEKEGHGWHERVIGEYKDKVRILEDKLRQVEDDRKGYEREETGNIRILEDKLKQLEEDRKGQENIQKQYEDNIRILKDQLRQAEEDRKGQGRIEVNHVVTIGVLENKLKEAEEDRKRQERIRKEHEDNIRILGDKLRQFQDTRGQGKIDKEHVDTIRILEGKLKQAEDDRTGYERALRESKDNERILMDKVKKFEKDSRDNEGTKEDVKSLEETHAKDTEWYKKILEERDGKIRELEGYLKEMTKSDESKNMRSLELSQGAKSVLKNLELRRTKNELERKVKNLEEQLNRKTAGNVVDDTKMSKKKDFEGKGEILKDVTTNLSNFQLVLEKSLDKKLQMVTNLETRLNRCVGKCNKISHKVKRSSSGIVEENVLQQCNLPELNTSLDTEYFAQEISNPENSAHGTMPPEDVTPGTLTRGSSPGTMVQENVTQEVALKEDLSQRQTDLDDIDGDKNPSEKTAGGMHPEYRSPRDRRPDLIPANVAATAGDSDPEKVDPKDYDAELNRLNAALLKERQINDEVIERFLELEETNKANQDTIGLLRAKLKRSQALKLENEALLRQVEELKGDPSFLLEQSITDGMVEDHEVPNSINEDMKVQAGTDREVEVHQRITGNNQILQATITESGLEDEKNTEGGVHQVITDNKADQGIMKDSRVKDGITMETEVHQEVADDKVHKNGEVQGEMSGHNVVQPGIKEDHNVHQGITMDHEVKKDPDGEHYVGIQRDAYEEKIDSLRMALELKDRQLSDLREKSGEDDELIEELRANFQREEKWNRELQRKYDWEMSSSANKDEQMEEFQDCLWEREKTVRQLQEQLEFEDKRCEELLEKLIASQREAEEYEAMVGNVQRKLEDKEKRIAEFCDQNDRDAIVIGNLSEENVRLRGEVERLTKARKHLEEDVETLNSSLTTVEQSKEIFIKKQEDDVNKLSVQLMEKEMTSKNKDEVIEELQENLVSLSIDVKEMEFRMEEGKFKQEEELIKVSETVKKKERELEEATERYKEMQEVCQSLRQEISQKNEQILEKDAEIATKREKVEAREKEIDELRGLCGSSTRLNGKPALVYTEAEMEEVNEHLEEERRTSETYRGQVELLEKEAKKSENRFLEMKGKFDAKSETLKNEMERTREDLHERENELERARKELEEQEHELAKTREILHERENKLEESRKELHDRESALEKTRKELNEQKHELEKAREELLDTKNELVEARKGEDELAKTRVELHEKENEMEEARKELRNTQSVLDKTRTELDEQKDKFDKTREELHEKENEMEEARKELRDRDSTLDKTRIELDEQKQKLNKTREELKQRVNELDKARNALRKTGDDLEATREKILENARNELHEKEALLEKTRNELHETNTLLKNARNEVAEKHSLLEKRELEVRNIKEELVSKENELIQCQIDLKGLYLKLGDLEKVKEELQGMTKNNAGELKTLRGDLGKLSKVNEQMKEELKLKEAALKRKEHENSEELNVLHSICKDMDGEKDGLEIKIRDRESELCTTRAQLEKLVDENDLLKVEVRKTKEDAQQSEIKNEEILKRMSSELKKLGNENEVLQGTVRDNESTLSTLRCNLEARLKDNEALKSEIDEYSAKLSSLAAENGDLQNEAQKLQEKLSQKEGELRDSQLSNVKLKYSLEEHTCRSREQARTMATYEKEVAALKAHIHEMDTLVQNIRSTMEYVRKSNSNTSLQIEGDGLSNVNSEPIGTGMDSTGKDGQNSTQSDVDRIYRDNSGLLGTPTDSIESFTVQMEESTKEPKGSEKLPQAGTVSQRDDSGPEETILDTTGSIIKVVKGAPLIQKDLESPLQNDGGLQKDKCKPQETILDTTGSIISVVNESLSAKEGLEPTLKDHADGSQRGNRGSLETMVDDLSKEAEGSPDFPEGEPLVTSTISEELSHSNNNGDISKLDMTSETPVAKGTKILNMIPTMNRFKYRSLYALIILGFLAVVFLVGCTNNSIISRKHLFMFANSVVSLIMFILWREEARRKASSEKMLQNGHVPATSLWGRGDELRQFTEIKSSFQELHEKFLEAVENSTQDTVPIQELYNDYEKLKDEVENMRQERLDKDNMVSVTEQEIPEGDLPGDGSPMGPIWKNAFLNLVKLITILLLCEIVYIRATTWPQLLRQAIFFLGSLVIACAMDMLCGDFTHDSRRAEQNVREVAREIDELNEIIDREHALVLKQREAIKALEKRLRREFERRIKQRNILLKKIRYKGRLEDLRGFLGDDKDSGEPNAEGKEDRKLTQDEDKMKFLKEILTEVKQPLNLDLTFSPMFFFVSIPLTGIMLSCRYFVLAALMMSFQVMVFLKEGKYVTGDLLPSVLQRQVNPIIMDSVVVLYACLLAVCLQCSQGIVVLVTCALAELCVHWWTCYRLATKEDALHEISNKFFVDNEKRT